MLVEGGRLHIQGMDHHGVYSSDLGGFDGPEKGVSYQFPSEPSSLMGSGHGKTSKDHDRDRVGHVSPNSAGSPCASYATDRKRVERDHPVPRERH